MYELKEIPGLEDYFIDNEGNVFSNKLMGKSKTKRHFKQLKTNMFNGYKIVGLYKDKVHKCYFIHRLVALTFFGEPSSPDLVVNHKDGNKLNNIPENLEWVTQSENLYHCWHILHKDIIDDSAQKRLAKQEERKLLKSIICVETGEIFESQVSLANKLGITKECLNNLIRKNQSYKNFHYLKLKDWEKFNSVSEFYSWKLNEKLKRRYEKFLLETGNKMKNKLKNKKKF